MTTITLAELTALSGRDVLDHLELEAAIPVVNGLQAQGDLIVIPHAMVEQTAVIGFRTWRKVPPSGVELLRSASGGNPHTLVADPYTCEWLPWPWDPTGLAIAALRNTSTVYLIHREHGATGIAPGTWVVRRQRERSTAGNSWSSSRRDVLVAD
ncbi:hypothetical protein Rhe02_02120 [Rhizocola hellebori]|uniref:Uncharacterized protein n=1 Tax=Rhizocola hellebori TaxID=1392758 RepID=A0A8J3Q1Q2_9ACTN|nr:hypothetical protein [Rhizocola hellebori]GIH02145.1 hypothetical protein Rhe02_02120 [Rhizocola hellebori]